MSESAEKARSLAPDYDVPENVSPFVMLPVLDLCRDCGEAVEPLRTWAVVRDGSVQKPLCWDCAAPSIPPGGGADAASARPGYDFRGRPLLPPAEEAR